MNLAKHPPCCPHHRLPGSHTCLCHPGCTCSSAPSRLPLSLFGAPVSRPFVLPISHVCSVGHLVLRLTFQQSPHPKSTLQEAWIEGQQYCLGKRNSALWTRRSTVNWAQLPNAYILTPSLPVVLKMQPSLCAHGTSLPPSHVSSARHIY